MKKEWFEME